MPKELRDYQIEDLAYLITNPRGGLLHDPGCGKTPPVCAYIEYLWTRCNTKSLWVMPKSLLHKNVQELLEFTNLRPTDIVVIDGTPKQREQQIRNPSAKVFLMGFKRFSDDWENLLEHHPEIDAVIVDEYHMGFKSVESQRTKQLFQSMRKLKRFVAMSGTLIAGRLDSCYSAIHIVEPRYYAGHYAFLAQHAIRDLDGKIIAWHNHAKLGAIFARHFRRRTFNEVYGEEAKVLQVLSCPMSERHRKAYDEFEERAYLELEDKFIEAGTPGVAVVRCRQIMAHPHALGLLEDKELTGKEEALMVIAEDHKNTGQPFVVFAVLQPEQERIAQLLSATGLRVALINGNVPAQKRGEIDEDFRAGRYDVVVGSPPTMAVGYNWGHVNHVVFSSLNYENVDFVQAYRRAIRGVRTIPLLINVLEYEDSIDQRIFQIVSKKSSDLEKIDASYEKLDFKKNKEEAMKSS